MPNNNTMNIIFLIGFGVAGYTIASKLLRENYWRVVPAIPTYEQRNKVCLNECADKSGELHEDCMDDCRSFNILPKRLHPSRRQKAWGFRRVAL